MRYSGDDMEENSIKKMHITVSQRPVLLKEK